jgi:hypothetical protein
MFDMHRAPPGSRRGIAERRTVREKNLITGIEQEAVNLRVRAVGGGIGDIEPVTKNHHAGEPP